MNRDPRVLPTSFRLASAAVALLFCAQILGIAFVPSTPKRVGPEDSAFGRHGAGADDNGSHPKMGASATGPTKRDEPPPRTAGLAAYKGLGSWIDLFNHGPWRDPARTVRRMARRDVRTIYLQTATYGSPAPIVYPNKVAQFIEQAHRRNIRVVAWSVPSFVHENHDFWRARAAVQFRTPKGEGFDSFGLDIEADIVDAIWKRNRRLMRLAKRLRAVAGPSYPLGAIVPDPAHNLYWPNFPYKRVARVFDVIVPMGYFTFRTKGFKRVRTYTASNIKVIRRETGDPEMPIHVIGGIADDVGVPAARGFIRAVRQKRVLGASLYDFPITSKATWHELSSLTRRRGHR